MSGTKYKCKNGLEGYYLGLSPLIFSISVCGYDVNIPIDSPLFEQLLIDTTHAPHLINFSVSDFITMSRPFSHFLEEGL